MQIFEGVGIALDSIKANKGRSSLTILGVGIGVAVVMVIAAMITGINSGVTDIFEQLGPRTFFVFREFQGGIQISDGSERNRRRRPFLTVQEAERLNELSGVDFVVVNNESNRPVESEGTSLES